MHFLVLSLTSSQTCRAFQKSTDPRTYLFSAFFSFLFLIVRYEQVNPAPREDPLRPRAVRKYGEAVTDFDPPPVRALPIRKNFRNFRASTKKIRIFIPVGMPSKLLAKSEKHISTELCLREVHSFNSNYPSFLKKSREYATKFADPEVHRIIFV